MEFPRRRFLHLAAGAAALPVVPSAPALGQGTIIPTNATMIVERTQYFAKPGLAADVLDLRRKDCGRPFLRRCAASNSHTIGVILHDRRGLGRGCI
jgi:hypothetical protein